MLMNKKILVLIMTLMALTVLTTPVMAIGPEKAVEVGNNPNTDTFQSTWAIETPSHVRISWDPNGEIILWRNANPNQGIMDNVAFVINSVLTMTYFGQNQAQFEGIWVYWSGEYAGGTFSTVMFPGEGSHGAIYWVHRVYGFSPAESLEVAMERPYGAYMRFHFVDGGQ
jgi:hypothetical protein